MKSKHYSLFLLSLFLLCSCQNNKQLEEALSLSSTNRIELEKVIWHNSLLLASIGMAVCTDFVPARGNRNNPHTWNTLIEKRRF